LVRGDAHGAFACIDLYAESVNGDLINDAVYERNSYLTEKYNFTINETRSEDSSAAGFPANIIRPIIMAQEDLYDVIYDSLTFTSPMAQEKMLFDLYDLPYIEFSKPYWDQNSNNDLSIGNKLYYTYGEHMLSVNAGLYGVFFNKQIVEDMNIENLYNVVNNNKWTIEKYYSIAKDIAYDLDGDGKMDYNDYWGLVTETYNAYTFLIAAGERIATKDNDDFPVLSLNTPRTADLLELTKSFLMDKNTTILVDNYTAKEWATVWNIFPEGRSIFCEGSLMQTPDLRSMEFDFGILPNPKFTENQDNYYHTLSVWNAPLMSIPVTITNPEKIGYILEILAAKSVDTLTPAYYDLQLTNKLIRDNESEKMIDIMLSSVTFDIGAVYDFGGLFGVVLNVGARSGTANFASSYAAAEKEAQAAIEKFLEKIK